MFETLRQRVRDIGTLETLFKSAERHANAEGQTEPGAEHLVMAALEMHDGTARRALERFRLGPVEFRDAVARQYAEALRSVGIETSPVAPIYGSSPVPTAKGVYKAQPSAQDLVYNLTSVKPFSSSAPLLGADVLVAATAGRHTVAVRALRALGLDPEALAEAARAEVAAYVDRVRSSTADCRPGR